MYIKGIYSGKSEKEIEELVIHEGFDPVKIKDSPGYIYTPHNHPSIKLIAILSGDMTAKVNRTTFVLKPGDKLVIPANMTHLAKIGKSGCTFFWNEKMI